MHTIEVGKGVEHLVLFVAAGGQVSCQFGVWVGVGETDVPFEVAEERRLEHGGGQVVAKTRDRECNAAALAGPHHSKLLAIDAGQGPGHIDARQASVSNRR